jgi:glycosyltransferase involved in cell wall biosynthesis
MDAGAPISVVMPCYNAALTIRASIASVFGQTDPNFELIVVDDGSTDGSAALLAEIAAGDRRLRWVRQPNRGAGPARNRGIAEVRGGLVAFLDADDSWAPTFLEKSRRALEAAPDAALAYCGWRNSGLEPARCKPYLPPDYERLGKPEWLFANCPWPIHAALVRKESLLEAGGFDERWKSCEDFGLWLRIGWRKRIVRVPEVLAFYHHAPNPGRVTANRVRVALDHWSIQREFLESHPELIDLLGKRRVRRLTHGELLRRGFEAYWQRDLGTARALFRRVMRQGYGGFKDWKYMLPSLLPEGWHRRLIAALERP